MSIQSSQHCVLKRLSSSLSILASMNWVIVRAPQVAQLVKNPPAMQETRLQFLGWEDPLEKGTATHSSILAWRIPWTVWGCKEWDMSEQLWLSNSLPLLSIYLICLFSFLYFLFNLVLFYDSIFFSCSGTLALLLCLTLVTFLRNFFPSCNPWT